jgi:Holliday junction DNA helicase RuvA
MYDFLEGTLVHRSPSRLVLDVGGVGYELAVPLSAVFGAGPRMRIWTHLVVREESHTLYGFPDRGTRDLFRLLLRVRGVGPVMALAALSGLDRDSLLEAIVQQNLRALTQIRGIGKKTAEQILLDLREKAAELVSAAGDAEGLRSVELEPRPRQVIERNVADAIAALVSIGFSEKDAKKHVEAAASKVDPLRLEELVRAALQS